MLACTTYQLADPQISARGAKSCALSSKENDRATFSLGTPLTPSSTPFGATCYGDEANQRKTLELRLTPEQDEEFLEFDTWAIDYLTEHSERLFKKKMTKTSIEEHYRSPVTRKEGYQPLLRCKLNTEGRHQVRVWDEDGQRTQLPEDLRDFDLVPRLSISHLWILGRDFGFCFNCFDLMVLGGGGSNENVCPFTN